MSTKDHEAFFAAYGALFRASCLIDLVGRDLSKQLLPEKHIQSANLADIYAAIKLLEYSAEKLDEHNQGVMENGERT